MTHECSSCPYGGIRIKSRGPADSPLVIVGDGVSPIELARKTAFIGPNNELLDKILAMTGFTSSGVEPLYINAIECFPRDKKSSDVKQKNKAGETRTLEGGKHKYERAIRNCNLRLLSEIRAHPRKLIITLGAGALHALTLDFKLKITQHRGNFIPTDLAEYGMLISVHPSFIIRGGGSLAQFKADFENAYSVFNKQGLPTYVEPTHTLLKTASQVRVLAALLKKHGKSKGDVGADIETGGFDFWKDGTLMLGLTTNGKHVYIVSEGMIIPELFENDCNFIWQNGKFDIKFLWQEKCTKATVHDDTMLMSYAMNEVGGIHDLEQLGKDWLQAPDYKFMVKPYLQNKKTSYRAIPIDVLASYLAKDVALTFQLKPVLLARLKQDPIVYKNYRKLLIPASNYLARVEWNGFLVDREWAMNEKLKMETELKEQSDLFQALAIKEWGKPVNTNSPLQLKEYLYKHLKLGHPDQSTDKDTLEDLGYHECLEPLLRIRKLQKYLSTYIMPCLLKVDNEGRIHATYKLHGTVTGRLASSGPNMQNIPRYPSVRGMFIASPGKILIECDLSQAELRSLAQLSGDEELCRIYNSAGEMSLHDEVTAEIFPDYLNPEVDKVAKKEMKMRGKTVNFGIVYGRQAFSFVAEFLISMAEAQRWIGKWFARFPKAKAFIDRCRLAVDKGETLVTPFGRKRRFGVITPERRQKLQNEASNFPHQSTASDITLTAGVICEPILWEKYEARVVNTVHDCMVIEADPKYKDAICKLVTSTMVAVPKAIGLRRVPFESEAEIGERWGHLEGYHGYLEQAGEEHV